MSQSFQDRFSQGMKQKGISYKDLSDKYEMVPSAFSKYATGTGWPSNKLLRDLCAYFEWDLVDTWLQVEFEKDQRGFIRPAIQTLFERLSK